MPDMKFILEVIPTVHNNTWQFTKCKINIKNYLSSSSGTIADES